MAYTESEYACHTDVYFDGIFSKLYGDNWYLESTVEILG